MEGPDKLFDELVRCGDNATDPHDVWAFPLKVGCYLTIRRPQTIDVEQISVFVTRLDQRLDNSHGPKGRKYGLNPIRTDA